jgi:hypothetical protein
MAKAGKERFVRAVLMLLAAVLAFGGPTYLFYILNRKLHFPHLISLLLGLASFTVGIILFVYLLKGEGKAGAST